MSRPRTLAQSASLAHSQRCVVVLQTLTPARPVQSLVELQPQSPVSAMHAAPRWLVGEHPALPQCVVQAPSEQRPEKS
jgi:hypothetical protein